MNATERNLLYWMAHLPRPDRPVVDLAIYSAGRRYGGFTSEEHARAVAREVVGSFA